jgi:hypothetical protein
MFWSEMTELKKLSRNCCTLLFNSLSKMLQNSPMSNKYMENFVRAMPPHLENNKGRRKKGDGERLKKEIGV